MYETLILELGDRAFIELVSESDVSEPFLRRLTIQARCEGR